MCDNPQRGQRRLYTEATPCDESRTSLLQGVAQFSSNSGITFCALPRKDFSAQYLYWAQLCSKNRKAFIFSGSLSKSLISVLLLKEPLNTILLAGGFQSPGQQDRGHGIQTAQTAAVCPDGEALEAAEQEPVS